MGSYVATPFSLSSLLCHEQTDSTFFFQQDDDDDEHENTIFINSSHNILEDEEDDEYIEYLFKQELGFGSSTTHFLSYHHDVDDDIFWLRNARLHAIDWIFNTQAKFGFTLQTAYLSITYFDRFLSKRSIDESKPWAIQLLSVACLSIAAKMEEQRVPPLSEYPIQFRFENKVIKNMEILILTTLEWKMGLPTPFAFLHYFFTKFCNQYSRSETIISKATQHIGTLVKDFNLMNQRPSIIASASILAAFDSSLTQKEIDIKIKLISSWGNIESEHVFSCYNVIQEKKRDKVKKTPSSDLLSKESNLTYVVENKSSGFSGVKRKLGYENIEDFQEQKLHRP
ncbi:cyclin-D5-3-like [Vicia villosa]|uniref:cyclin-D5-3-like n=1 Tax=Vicia villosa TaxID=3911 RepID=UPI00273C2F14|nr:cyclin-D5-3-like [Vicia villosa]